MPSIYESLLNRKASLELLIREKERALSKAPEGTLHIRSHGSYVQYYISTEQQKDKYLLRKQDVFAKSLAQKKYDERILNSAKKELKAIDGLQRRIPEIMVEDVYTNLSKDRQKLVTPIVLPDKEFADQWQNVPYERKKFMEDSPEFFTAKGERVRSKSEILIADMLNKLHIPYRYEYPLDLKGIGTIYPDFTMLNVKLRKEVYLEHLGMMDDPVYLENALQRISIYEQNGIFPGDRLILLHETSTHPLNIRAAERAIRYYIN